MTTCETGPEVGVSWLGQLCQTTSTQNPNDGNYVSGTNVVSRTSTEWKVLAHEIGHSMGAMHDCTDDLCAIGDDTASKCCPYSKGTCDAAGRFIMNPSTSDSVEEFSP